LALVLFVGACQPVMPVTEQQPAGLSSDAPAYAVHGPHAVGYQSLVSVEGTEQALALSLWYPALNPSGAEEKVSYDMQIKDATWAGDRQTVVDGHALLDADIDAAQGPYPLVVFSHGFSMSAAGYSLSAEHYTSHGFIVLAPDHKEQFDPTWEDMWKSAIDRPRDVKLTLDYAEELTAPGGALAGLIDMEHVAVVGHSYGGYTALAMAGAQVDLEAYNARCAQLVADDWRSFLCAPIVPREAEMAARAGLDPMPVGLWPSFGDPRVTAIIPMAGNSYLFDQEGLSNITIPMMAIGGSADTGTPYDWGTKPSYDYAASEQKALVTLTGAEHMIFVTPGEYQP
jgi:predicted dienelactone hydrolase